MKRSLSSILSAVAVLFLVAGISIPMTGCAGQKVRDSAGVAVLDLADQNVVNDMRRGIDLIAASDPDFNFAQASSNIDTFEAAVTSDRWSVATVALPLWPIVSSYAFDGFDLDIANGDLSEASATLLRRRTVEFGVVLSQVSDGAEPSDDSND